MSGCKDKASRAAAEDTDQTSAKPKIKSLLEIDPWRDVPGYCETVEPPLKQGRFDRASVGHQQTEVMKVYPKAQEKTEKLSEPSQSTIPSLFDIDPFKVNVLTPETTTSPETDEEVENQVEAPPVVAPLISAQVASQHPQSVTENTTQASSTKHVPSLFDIDPFGGREPLLPWLGMQQATILPTKIPRHKPAKHIMKNNMVDPETVTLLHEAIFSSNVDKAEQLLASGVSADTLGENSRTPLTSAVHTGQLKLCEILIKYGASVNLRDANGNTPLLVLASKLPEEFNPKIAQIAALLIDNNAGCEAVNQAGFNVLHLACKSGNTELTQLVLPLSDVNTTTVDGSTPLHIVAKHCHDDIAEMLLEAGADPNLQDSASETPLIIAARGGAVTIVEKLLKADCDVNLKGFMEYTALHWAVHGGYKHVTKLLLDHGVAFNAQSALGRSPLHRAVGAGHADIAEMLVVAGADIELIDGNGETPLATATRFGFLEIVRLLLRHNANPDPPCPLAKAPLVKAILSGFREISELLINVDCDLSLLSILSNDLFCKGNLSWLASKENMRAFISEHQHLIEQPRQLKQLCRYCIRQQLRLNRAPVHNIQLLPVPQFLKSYINLTDEFSVETQSS